MFLNKRALLLLMIVALASSFNACDSSSSSSGEIPMAYADLPGTLISENTTWSGTKTIVGAVYVLPGVTLTITAGSTIKFVFHDNNPDSVGAIITLRGDATSFSDGARPSGRLVAVGTATNPIVFTSAKATPAAGDWGGIILIGEATNNVVGGEGDVEGLATEIKYGGTKDTDDSGVLQYVRIEYCGFGIATDSEINGLSLYSVGSGTTIDHVQVYKCTDDGYEWFGGTVNSKYLISSFNDDDSFDFDQGFRGKNQFWLAVQAPGADNGFENDGRATIGSGTETNPTIYNVTVVGFGGPKDASDANAGLRLREDLKGTYRNFVIANFDGAAFRLDSSVANDATRGNYRSGTLSVKNVVLYNNNIAGNNANGGFGSATDSTVYGAAANSVTFGNPNFSNAGQNDYRLMAGSPALSNGATPPSDGFFDVTATYRGAFNSSTNWATGAWVRWTDGI